MNEVRLIDANALKYKNLAEVNGKLTYVLTAEEIDNAPTVETEEIAKLKRENNALEQEMLYCRENWKKAERPQGEWIPVSERLPDDLEPVNITWINHCPEPYYKETKDKPFTATGVYFNGQWYWWSTLCADTLAEYSHNFDDVVDGSIEVIAWQPLPEPYEKGGAE